MARERNATPQTGRSCLPTRWPCSNDLFLKRPERTGALGFILLAALLTWNLMEHVMRVHLKRAGSTISGWDRKPTSTPTSFMMTTKFKGLLMARIGEEWHFTAPLSGEHC